MKPVGTCLFLAVALGGLAEGGAAAPVAERKGLTAGGARRVAAAAVAEAKKRQAPGGAIAIVDDGGHLLYLVRLDGTFGAAANVSLRKARTAATFRRATRDFENGVKSGRTSLVAVPEITPLQGGVPIVVDGQVVGAIGVSGAASAQQDDDIATAAAGALATAEEPGEPGDVTAGPAADGNGLTLAGARSIAAAAAAEARKTGSGGAIAVVDEGGYLLYAERLEGTFPAAAAVATRKARTAATFRRATRDFEEAIRSGRASLAAIPDDMTPLQGGVPVRAGGRVVGAVGVTGAASAQVDEEMAIAGAAVVK